jgi:hypothetical protein
MKTIDISQLVLVSGGAGGDRSDLFRRRIEGGLIANTGVAGSVKVDGGSFSGSTGTAKVTAFPSWGGSISGTCKASVLKGEGEIGQISCSPRALQNLVRH